MSKAEWIKEFLKPSEHYAGLILGKEGAPDQHIILLPGDIKVPSWEKGLQFAADCGGELPTRREQRILYANAKEHFQPTWYWSCEQHAAIPDYAWGQGFDNGNQYSYRKTFEGRARAVRRLIIF
jgi:hypothetical protein